MIRQLIYRRSKDSSILTSKLYCDRTFYDAFGYDLKRASKEVLIESPFIANYRTDTLLPIFKKLTKKAVILARVSSKSQEDEGYSLDSQVKLLENYCDGKGLIAMEIFKITESASKSMQRNVFKKALAYIEEHDIKHLVIEKVDRHVRNLHDAVETHDWLISDENKQVHFVKDSLVLHKNSRSQEWLNWGIRVVMAKNYIDNLREEAMKGWAEKLCYSDNFSLIAVTTSGRMTSIKWPLPDNS